MKILILCVLSFLLVSCGQWLSDEAGNKWEENHIHGTGAHTHDDMWESEKESWEEQHEPVIPVSDFWASVEWASELGDYNVSLSWSEVKVHGSLYNSSGSFLGDTDILYWYNLWESFEETWKVTTSLEWQYYFNTVATKLAQSYYYLDIKVWEITSRIYFVPNDFDANIFVKKYKDLPDNMYFARIVKLEDDIISWVDILADPS
jgi:hypothetical protein